MIIYLITIALTTFLAWLYENVMKKQKKIVFAIMVMIPAIVSGLRGVGTDYHLYNERFELMQNGTFNIAELNLLYVVMQLFTRIGFSYQFFIFLTSVATVLTAFYIIIQYEREINLKFGVLSYMLTFYQMSFNIYRQVLGSELFILALLFLLKKKNKKAFWIIFFLAAFVHTSIIPFALIYFIIPLTQQRKLARKRFTVYILLSILVAVLPLMSELLIKVARRLPHYAFYLSNFEYSDIGVGVFRYIILAVLPAMLIYRCKNSEDDVLVLNEVKTFSFLSVVGTILWMMSYISTTYLYRLGYISLIVMPIIHGYMIKRMKRDKIYFAVSLAIIAALLFFWWYDFIVLNSGDTYPYHFFWQDAAEFV